MADRFYRPYRAGSDASDEAPITNVEAGLDGSGATGRNTFSPVSDGSEFATESDRSGDAYAPQNTFVPPDRAELYRLGSMNLVDATKQMNLSKTGYAAFSSLDSNAEPLSGKGTGRNDILYGTTAFKTNATSRTSLLMINSLDRDRQAFPQPTRLQLHFPRVYTDITTFQVTQIKLLSAFLYFRESKFNTFFDVWEQGRYMAAGDSNIIRVRIREGSYDINSLLNELQLQMNTSPIFFYFPGGFNDFAATFTVNGDLAANFNLPGDYYYDSLLERYVPNPTLNYIVTRYFSTRFAAQNAYTLNQIQVAYYYPVLKEALLDAEEALKIRLPANDADAYVRIVFNFQGLDDAYVLSVIEANQAELDRFRAASTFENALVNNYSWTYQTYNNRTNVASSNLNTSIVSQINQQSNIFLSNYLTQIGLNTAQYLALINRTQQQNAILTDMYNYLQRQLGTYFAVNFGSYALALLANPTSQIHIQNGRDAAGVYTSYTPEYIAALNAGTIRPLPNFDYVPSSPTVQWPGMSTLTAPTADIQEVGGNFYVNSNVQDRLNIYNFTLSNFESDTLLTDTNGIINQNLKYGSAEVVANISAGQYVLFPFRSPARQTLQVETLARPYIYRYKDYNTTAYSGLIPFMFNTEYEFGAPTGEETAAGLTATTISGLVFGDSRATVAAGTPITTLNVLSNAAFYEVQMPLPPASPDPSVVGFDYSLNVEIANFSTSAALGVYIYHDRAAFMADARNLRDEKPLNYLSNFYVSTGTTAPQTMTVLAGNTYYFSLRPDATSFETTGFQFLTYWSAGAVPRPLQSNFDVVQAGISTFAEQYGLAYANTVSSVNYFFYKTYNSNYIQLPIQNALLGVNPGAQQFNIQYSNGAPAIGYDDNGISNDLTDYVGFRAGVPAFIPSTQFAVDPITGYMFNSQSPYNSASNVQSYFYGGSSNTILLPTSLQPYTPSTVMEREYKIVHYHDPNCLGPQEFEAGTGYSLIGLSTLSTMSVYTSSTTSGPIGGYSYVNDTDLGASTLRLGSGVSGIAFLPTEGVWNVKSFAFKSAYMGATDPNDRIKYIGIFDTNSITNRVPREQINMASALAVLSVATKVVYNQSTVNSLNGFDPSYGTWRNYAYLSNFPYTRPDLVDQGLPGYTPYPSTLVNGEGNFYSALAFDENYQLITYFMLAGSPVANPDAATWVPSTTYLNLTPADGKEVVFPTPTTWAGTCNFYQSKYQQSVPIGTQALNYLDPLSLYEDILAIQNYNPFGGFVGNPAFTLRTANYFEGANQILLFGDTTGASPATIDMYRVDNPGNVVGTRGTTFINQIDISALFGGEQVITWGANTTALYVLTRPNPVTQDAKIYSVTGLTTTPSATLYHSFLLEGTAWIGPPVPVYPVFSTAVARLQVTDRGDWTYSDDMYSSTGPTYNLRGIIQYNNEPTVSTFTCVQYASPNTNDRFRFFDVTTNPGATGSWTLFDDNVTQYEVARRLDFSTSQTVDSSLNGQIYNLVGPGYFTDSREYLFGPTYWPNLCNIAMTSDNELYGISYTSPQRFQYIAPTSAGPSGFTVTSNASLIASEAQISSIVNPVFGFGMDGSNGIWFSWQMGDALSPMPIQIDGNTRIRDDVNYGLKTAYQVFYPTMKIGLTKQFTTYNDITNLVDIDYFGSNYFEYPKTQAFYYSNFTSLLGDISYTVGPTRFWRWGMESNFVRGDTGFQGYEFNSYIYNISMSTSGAIAPAVTCNIVGLNGDPDSYQWLALRAYSPAEDSQCMVRFNLANRYDYGLVNQSNIVEEISTALSTTALSNYNPNYVIDLLTFNSSFAITSNYGANALSNFAGSTITTTSYSNWYSVFSTTYGQWLPSTTVVNAVASNVASNLEAYISTYYGTILPSSVIERLRITDALPFELLFSTSVAPQVASNDVFWGLGYNLGFARSNYSNNTVYVAPSFYKILEDYIYLQMNDELSMNRLDLTRRENYSQTLDSTGDVDKYNAKLLLANFGAYAQTAVQNPVSFNPSLGRLDRLTFTWVDQNGNVIDNNDCEWSAVLQIVEQRNVQTVGSTLPKL
jgi:hypothetical protein